MGILQFFEKKKEYVDKPLTKEAYNTMIFYCEKNYFLQLLKEFGLVFLLILLEYYKETEDYLKCKEIVETIDNSNKNFGTNYVNKLEDYVLS